MKKILMTVSSLTTLIIANNSFATIFNQNTSVNTNLKSTINDEQTSLFNNEYDHLSTSEWITNQSTTDHKFYSYDTSKADSISDSARNAFLVNNQGELIYNPDFKIPSADRFKFDNTKQEMIDHKNVTSIKDDDNPCSKSLYSNSYFSGDNQSWQFLQQGGVEKHIDISSQSSASKVTNYNSLSETMGLCYIAQAIKPLGIDEGVADDLGQYFISQSSLKNDISKDLTNNIIHIIANNEYVKNFMDATPKTITNKNYSMNYIFDSNNNLIEVYYNQWDNKNISDIAVNANYSIDIDHPDSGSSDQFTILKNWNNYAQTWEDFSSKYSNFIFDNNSIIFAKAKLYGEQDLNIVGNDINVICSNITTDSSKAYFILKPYVSGTRTGTNLYVRIWHDEHDIKLQIYYETTEGIWVPDNAEHQILVKLIYCTFNNVMS